MIIFISLSSQLYLWSKADLSWKVRIFLI